MAEALREANDYEVVVTTSGGLWRYRLGDRVRVTGFIGKTPSLKFLGRGDDVSDFFGEKLSEPFVLEVFRELFCGHPPSFTLLAPDQDEIGCRYTLYVEGPMRPHWAQSLDLSLRRNPHYAYCRDLGQLLPVRLFQIARDGFITFADYQAATGTRLGGIKPAVLCKTSGWSRIFRGQYVDEMTSSTRAREDLNFCTPLFPGSP